MQLPFSDSWTAKKPADGLGCRLASCPIPTAGRGAFTHTAFRMSYHKDSLADSRLVIKTQKASLAPGPSANNGFSQTSETLSGTASTNIISDNPKKINTPDEKSSDRFDTDYLSAVERGDMKTAQKMVGKAAKRDIVPRACNARPYDCKGNVCYDFQELRGNTVGAD